MTLAGHTTGLHSLAYSPDGDYIATSSDFPDPRIIVWDAASGDKIYSIETPGWAREVAFSPSSELLAAGGFNGFVSVWNMETGRLVVTMTGESTAINSLVFLPDGNRLMTGSVKSASMWDIATGAELLTLVPQQSLHVALSKDGRRAYMGTGGDTPGVRVYAVPLEDTIALAEHRLTRSLSEDECRQYLHLEACPEE